MAKSLNEVRPVPCTEVAVTVPRVGLVQTPESNFLSIKFVVLASTSPATKLKSRVIIIKSHAAIGQIPNTDWTVFTGEKTGSRNIRMISGCS